MNLTPLFEEALQFQAYNGTLLSNGKVAVYHLGRTRLADIYDSPDATVPLQNPVILDNLGMQPVYVSPDFNYTMVVTDQYNQELFSVDKYIYSDGDHAHADVAVGPSESIGVSSYTVGDTTIYVPYLTSAVGKVYSGIDPIVVNNEQDLISANTVPFGVQEPLYLAEDSTATIIGCSGDTTPYTNTDRTIKIEDHKVSTDMQAVMIRQQINTSSTDYKYAKICEADLNTLTWINEWMTTLQLNFQSCGAYYKGKSVGTFVLNCENYVQSSQTYVQKHEEDGKWVLFDKDNNSPQIVKLYLYWRDDFSSQHYELWGEFANLKYYEGVGVAAVLNCSLRNHLTSSLPIDQERNIWRFNPIGIETLKNALPTNVGNLVGQYSPEDASIKPITDDSAGTFYATYTYGGPDSGNTSYEDIKAAYDAGKAIFVKFKESAASTETEIFSLVGFWELPNRPDLNRFQFQNLDQWFGKTIYRFPSNWGKMSDHSFADADHLWTLEQSIAVDDFLVPIPSPSGVYCSRNYNIYRALEPITSNTWVDSAWEQVTIGEVLYNLEHTSADSDIFWAEYDTTTHTEVNDAVNAGKQVICRVGSNIYLQLSYVSVVNGYPVFYFTGGEPEISDSTMVVMQCHLSVNGWEDSYQWYPLANNNWVTAYVTDKTSGALSSIYQPYAASATTGNLVFSAERYPRQTFACISGTDTTATAGILPPVPERNLSSTQILVAASGSLADVAWREFDVSALTGKQDTLTFHYLEI